jgi:hypothetical protein
MRELVHLRWSGHVVGMGMRDTPEWPVRLEYMERDPKEDPPQTWDDFEGKSDKTE